MTGAQVAGGLLVAAPFVVMAVLMVRDIGWRSTVGVFAIVAATVACVLAGVRLLGVQ